MKNNGTHFLALDGRVDGMTMFKFYPEEVWPFQIHGFKLFVHEMAFKFGGKVETVGMYSVSEFHTGDLLFTGYESVEQAERLSRKAIRIMSKELRAVMRQGVERIKARAGK